MTTTGAIGVIGVGLMGSAIVGRLLERGHRLLVRDIDPDRETQAAAAGAQVMTSPRELAVACAAVIVAVVDAAQTQAVLFGEQGAAAALAPGQVLLLCPTIAPAEVGQIAAQLQPHGVAVIDAPMSGGPARARAGTMSLMVACPDEVLGRWRPLLDDMASAVFHVGTRPGDGARTKLVNNLLAAINLAGAAEVLALAERLGLDAVRTLEVIERSSGQSWIGVERMRRALAGDPTLTAQMSLLTKDSALALAEARRAGVPTPMGASAAAQFRAAVDAGWAAADDAQLLTLARLRPALPPPESAG